MGLWKSFLSHNDFWDQNAKLKFLKKISVLSADFIELKYR